MPSPTARSMKWFRDRGFIVAKVEQRLPIPGVFITRDAFGFGDLLVAKKGFGIALVQVTGSSNVSGRIAKMHDAKHRRDLKAWFAARGRVIVHGWATKSKKGHFREARLTEREIRK